MVTIEKIIEEYGKYYLNSGQNKSRLHGVPFIQSETLNIPGMRHLNIKDTIYQMANPVFTKLLQQRRRVPAQRGAASQREDRHRALPSRH